MESYFNNFLFTYLPHIAFAVFWFGLVSRLVFANKGIQAKSTQFISDKIVFWGSNFFHIGIIAVFLGHFTLLIPEDLYHLLMSTETKRIVALVAGSFFGMMTFVGMALLLYRRSKIERLKVQSNFADYAILALLIIEATFGLTAIYITANSSLQDYAALAIWAQNIVSFQPDAGAVLAGHSIMYKIHIVIGLIIIMIFPYTKLMHMLVFPLAYLYRKGFQLVRKGF